MNNGYERRLRRAIFYFSLCILCLLFECMNIGTNLANKQVKLRKQNITFLLPVHTVHADAGHEQIWR